MAPASRLTSIPPVAQPHLQGDCGKHDKQRHADLQPGELSQSGDESPAIYAWVSREMTLSGMFSGDASVGRFAGI